MTFSAFHHRNHAVQKSFAWIRRNPNHNPIRQNACSARNSISVTAGFTDHGRAFTGNSALIYRGDSLDDFAIAGQLIQMMKDPTPAKIISWDSELSMDRKEFYATKNPGAVYETVAFDHPEFAAPFLLVANKFAAVTLGGDSYTPAPMTIKAPSSKGGERPRLTLAFPRQVVGRQFKQQLALIAAAGSVLSAVTSSFAIVLIGRAMQGASVPVLPLFKHWWKPLLLGNAGVVACFAIFYLSTTFALAQGTGSLGFGRTEFLSAQLAANLFLALGILVAAVWSDRIGPARVLARGMVLTMVVGAGFGAGLYSGSLLVIFLTLGLALFAMGLCYGPLGGWLPTLFPVALRYSGISIAFSAGGVIGGALVPMAATALAGQGQGLAVGLLMSAAALLSLLGVLLARPAPDGAE